MRSEELQLQTDDTAILVIDVQEKLFTVMHEGLRQRLEANLVRLGQAAKQLGVPALLTEQYPKGLGPTLSSVLEAFSWAPKPMPKMVFDACGDAGTAATVEAVGKKRIVVAGMESHICVYQTVRTLVEMGHVVHVLADAVAARTEDNYRIGIDLCKMAGGIISSTETVLFDWISGAGSDDFKAISKLVR